jgi:hypothetical protein
LCFQDLREKLKETGTRRLIWLNQEDDFFGIVGEKGLNHLGQILMETRTDIHNNKDLQGKITDWRFFKKFHLYRNISLDRHKYCY